MQMEFITSNPILAQQGGTMFFGPPNSTTAHHVDELFDIIFWLSAFFFVLIIGIMIYFVLKYHSRPGHSEQKSPSHNNILEVSWSIIPGILLGVIFAKGFIGYLDMREAPDNAYEIQVIAKKWNWAFLYPNGYIDNNLHVPVGRPIRLVQSSEDVIHSLFVPAFRIKMDCVPGRYTETWFEAENATGTGIIAESHEPHDLYCTEYCGEQHSTMLAKVYVYEDGQFENWLEKASNLFETMSPVEVGEYLYKKRGCAQCHSIDGSAKAGPSFKGIFGKQHQMTSGEMVEVDENYLRESIRNPQAKIRSGYKPVMPAFNSTQIKDRELLALIQYIKSIE